MLLDPPRWRIGDQVQAVMVDTGRRVTGELVCYRADGWAMLRLPARPGEVAPIVRASLQLRQDPVRGRAAAEARKAKAWNEQTKAALAELVDGAVHPVRAARDGGA